MLSNYELSAFLLFIYVSNYFNPNYKLLAQIFALTGPASPLFPQVVTSSPAPAPSHACGLDLGHATKQAAPGGEVLFQAPKQALLLSAEQFLFIMSKETHIFVFD